MNRGVINCGEQLLLSFVFEGRVAVKIMVIKHEEKQYHFTDLIGINPANQILS